MLHLTPLTCHTHRYPSLQCAIKKISNVFDNIADATRILRELKILRLLRGHADIVELKSILLPHDPRSFKDLFVIFELMDTDLHTVIEANPDLTPEHHKVWMRGLRVCVWGGSGDIGPLGFVIPPPYNYLILL